MHETDQESHRWPYMGRVHSSTIFTGSGTEWLPSVSTTQKRIRGMFRHARRIHSMGKFDTQKFREEILSRWDWEASHLVPEMPGCKWWLCRKIVWNVTYLIEFFWQFLVVFCIRKKYASLLMVCPSYMQICFLDSLEIIHHHLCLKARLSINIFMERFFKNIKKEWYVLRWLYTMRDAWFVCVMRAIRK